MFYLDIQGFILIYGLPAVIISVVVGIISIVFDLIFKNKFNAIKNYLPFLLSVGLLFLYDAIFGTAFVCPAEIISAGLICGSVSTGIYALFIRIKNGKSVFIEPDVLIIEGILSGIILEDKKEETAKNIVSFFLSASKEDSAEILAQKVAEILKLHKTKETTEEKLGQCAKLIAKIFLDKRPLKK